MIILDTNVISEFVGPRPDANVTRWLDAQDGDDVYLTAVTIGELRAGVAILPPGQRRTRLSAEVERHIATFEDRILDFGAECTRDYAEVCSRRRRRGRPITDLDAQIAATVRAHRGVLATRNVKDFEDIGLVLVNPWEAS